MIASTPRQPFNLQLHNIVFQALQNNYEQLMLPA